MKLNLVLATAVFSAVVLAADLSDSSKASSKTDSSVSKADSSASETDSSASKADSVTDSSASKTDCVCYRGSDLGLQLYRHQEPQELFDQDSQEQICFFQVVFF